MTYPPRRRWSFFDIDFSHREWSFLPTMLSRCWFVRNPNHYFRSSLSTFSLLLAASLCFIRLLAASLCFIRLLDAFFRWFVPSFSFSMHSFAGSSLHSPSCCILSLVRPFILLLAAFFRWFVPSFAFFPVWILFSSLHHSFLLVFRLVCLFAGSSEWTFGRFVTPFSFLSMLRPSFVLLLVIWPCFLSIFHSLIFLVPSLRLLMIV